MSWNLADAEKRAAASPESFTIPADSVRHTLKHGDLAKLIFEANDAGERMWVRVTNTLGDGGYVGVLMNEPVTIDQLHYGDGVEFEARHVIEVEFSK